MRRLLLFMLALALVLPILAQDVTQETKAEVKAWSLLGSQSRELQRLLTQFNEQLAALLSEYRVELKKVYPDMPDNAEFSFETYSFQSPAEIPPVKEKKDAGK